MVCLKLRVKCKMYLKMDHYTKKTKCIFKNSVLVNNI